MCSSMNAFMGELGVICGARDVKENKGERRREISLLAVGLRALVV